ncbi:hypothetical protein VTP01DRAFT_2972 [Rhizomucor pusillus]|uniref:uncharacterized protein n=1 Tax=Rhizomucor pusillus TaxID=4840 RepID=UPI0037448165
MRKLKIVLQQATAAEETRALYAPVLEKLEKLGITTELALFRSDLEAVSRSAGVPLQLLEALERQISLICMVEETKSVPETTIFSTGMPKLDDALGGGLRSNQITEICGNMRFGMSKLSIRSMIAYLRASNDAKAVHIDTKGTFDPRTIHENGGTLSSIDCHDILARIECFQAFTVTQMNRVLEQIGASTAVRSSRYLIIVEDVSNILCTDWEITHEQVKALTMNFGKISRFGCPILILRTVDKEKDKALAAAIMQNWEKTIDVRLFLSPGTQPRESSCRIERTRGWVVPDKSIVFFGEPCE